MSIKAGVVGNRWRSVSWWVSSEVVMAEELVISGILRSCGCIKWSRNQGDKCVSDPKLKMIEAMFFKRLSKPEYFTRSENRVVNWIMSDVFPRTYVFGNSNQLQGCDWEWTQWC